MAWNLEVIFFRLILRTLFFGFWIFTSFFYYVFLSQLENYIAHNKKIKVEIQKSEKDEFSDKSKEDNFHVSGYYLKKWKMSLLFCGQILRFRQIAIKVCARRVITSKFKICNCDNFG